MNIRPFFSIFAAALMLVSSSTIASSFSVSPGEMHITPGKPNYYTVRNASERPLAIVVEVETWKINDDGIETNEPTDALIVYPKRFIVREKSQKKIRVSCRERATRQKEESYRITIKELPVAFGDEEFHGIYMAIAYRTACYVKPIKAKPKIVMKDAKVVGDKLYLTIENQGNAHQHLYSPDLKIITAEGIEFSIDNKDVAKHLGKENLHADSKREFTLDIKDLDQIPTIKDLTLSFEKNSKKIKQKVPLQVDPSTIALQQSDSTPGS